MILIDRLNENGRNLREVNLPMQTAQKFKEFAECLD